MHNSESKQHELIREKTYIEPVLKITDDRFEAENLAQYRLFLLAGPIRLHFCVIDSETNRCLALESFTTNVEVSSVLFTEKLSQIVENHPYLPARFWKSIHVCIANDKFTLIPLSLFREENSINYLQLNCEVESEINYVTNYLHKQSGIANIFAFGIRYYDWTKSFYPGRNVQFMHHTSPLIEAALRQNSQYKTSMTVCVGYEYMSILVKDGEGLKFCNKFFFKTDEDFLYYFFLVADEVGLHHNTPISIYGEINPKSSNFILLKKYFPNVHFGQRPSTLQFGYVFDEIPEHSYFDLFSMCYCVS